MAIAILKDQRERAKAEGKFLFQVSLDARYVPQELKEKFKGKVFMGKWEMTGPMSAEDAVKVWRLFQKLTAHKKI